MPIWFLFLFKGSSPTWGSEIFVHHDRQNALSSAHIHLRKGSGYYVRFGCKITETHLIIKPAFRVNLLKCTHSMAKRCAKGDWFFAALPREELERLRAKAMHLWREDHDALSRPVSVACNNRRLRGIWDKGTIIPHCDPTEWRWDACGATIGFAAYGTTSRYGWAIDHIYPVARGGSDALKNLRPLHWLNNAAKGHRYPWRASKGRADW